MITTESDSLWNRLKQQAWIPAASVIILALLIRLVGLGAESAWIDEGYSLELAKHSIPEILRGTAADQHPPLYYLLLHAWLWAGSGVFHARLFSVILGVVNVYQVLVFARQLKGEWLGIASATLLAINPMHVWYSQEIRQYMLLLVLTSASMMEFWACLQGKGRWWTYGFFTLLALYTQYFAVFIVVAQVLLGLVWVIRRRDGRFLRNWLITLGMVGLLFVPWLPTAVNQFLFHTMPWIGEPEAGQIRDIPLRLVLGSGVLMLPGWVRWSGLGVFAAVLSWVLRRMYEGKMTSTHQMGFVIVWGVVPYLVISGMSVVYPLFQFKQFLILLPAFLMLATAVCEMLPGRWKCAAYFALLVVPLFSLVYQQTTLSKDDWRGLSAHIRSEFQIGDMIYTNPAAASLALDLYLGHSAPVKGYPPDFDILTGGWQGQPITPEIVTKELNPLSEESKRVWLVEFFPELWDENGLIPEWLNEKANLIGDQQFGNIRLRLYRFENSSP